MLRFLLAIAACVGAVELLIYTWFAQLVPERNPPPPREFPDEVDAD
jgi:hypothetical protein